MMHHYGQRSERIDKCTVDFQKLPSTITIYLYRVYRKTWAKLKGMIVQIKTNNIKQESKGPKRFPKEIAFIKV